MRALKMITTATEARRLVVWSRREKPTVDEVLERIEAYAKNGKVQVPYPTKLPELTAGALRARGFSVTVGAHGTLIDWTDPIVKKCIKCGDRLNGHEDERKDECRFCVTCVPSSGADAATPPVSRATAELVDEVAGKAS
jgi:hypothetical protein